MKRYGYLVVEGQHDIAFVTRLFQKWALKPVVHKSELEPFWHGVIPRDFPVNDDLLKRVPMPAFFENDSHSIAVHAAQAFARLIDTLDETRAVLDYARIASYGFLLDADDTAQTPKQRFDKLIADLRERRTNLPIPDNPGEVAGSIPSFGIYIFPDNQSAGTLEDILLQGGEANYADLASAARSYINGFDKSRLLPQDLKEFSKPAGAKKAHIGSMASILKPGKAIQNSIVDNRWLDGDLPLVKSVQNFLAKLFDLN